MTGSRGQPGAGDLGGLPGDQRATIARINQIADQFFRDELRSSWVPGYLVARGFSSAVQAYWHAGYAPAAWNALISHLHARGYTDVLIEQAGLGRRSARGSLIDTFRDRAMFPIRSPDGTVAGFIGRAPRDAAPGVPKYLNSPRTCLYDKSTLLFGLSEAREELAAGLRPVIVEGPLDAIAVTTAGQGRFVGLAPCGTALTARHVAALAQAANLRTAGVAVAFDADPAGRRAAARAYCLLSPFTDNLDAVDLQPGTDPAHILAKQGPIALAELVSHRIQPLADVVVDGEVAKWNPWLGHAEGQINAMHAAAHLIAAMPPAHVGRQVARLADRLGLYHGLITEAVTDELSKTSACHSTWSPLAARPTYRLRGSR